MLLDFLIGGSSAIISRTLTAPMELFKIQRQNYFIPNATIKDVLKKEGSRFLWKGNYANCMRAFPQFAITNTVYEQVSNNRVVKHVVKDDIKRNLISGMIGGNIGMICIYPLETIKTHLALQTNKSHYSNIFDAFKKMRIKQMYNGLSTSMFGFGMYSSIMYTSNNHLNKKIFKRTSVNDNTKKVLIGGFSGVTAISITYPTDLIRRRLQLQGFDKTVPEYNGFFDCLIKIVSKEGIRGIYRGYSANIIKTFFMTGIQFWCMDFFKVFKQD